MNKKCSKWKVDASRLTKNRSFVTHPHKDEYFQLQLAMEELCGNVEFLVEVGLLSKRNSSFNHVTISPTTSSRQQAPSKKTPKTYQHHPPIGFLVLMSRCAEAKGSHLTGTSKSDTLATDLSGKFPGTWWDVFFGNERQFFEKKEDGGEKKRE